MHLETIFNQVSSLLKKEQIDESHQNAELILWDILGFKNKSDLYLNRRKEIPEAKALQILQAVQERLKGKPIQYILGKTEFFSLPLEVSESCLIPRPETEQLVNQAIVWLKEQNLSSPKILDIGTGSGNIDIAIAKNISSAKILSLDVSKDALEIAHKNIRNHQVENRIHLIASDLTQGLKSKTSFDMIISNPPYIDEKSWDTLPKEIRLFEPYVALCSKEKGLEIIFKIIETASHFLRPEGLLLIEFGTSDQISEIQEALKRTQNFDSIEFLKDLALKDRMVKALRRK